MRKPSSISFGHIARNSHNNFIGSCKCLYSFLGSAGALSANSTHRINTIAHFICQLVAELITSADPFCCRLLTSPMMHTCPPTLVISASSPSLTAIRFHWLEELSIDRLFLTSRLHRETQLADGSGKAIRSSNVCPLPRGCLPSPPPPSVTGDYATTCPRWTQKLAKIV